MKNKILIASLIVLFGCDPLGRLVGTPKHEDSTSTPATEYLEGSLRGANFVDIDEDTKVLSVYIKRKGTWIGLVAYDKGQDKKEPAYIISKTTVVFFNTTPDDEYSIKISH